MQMNEDVKHMSAPRSHFNWMLLALLAGTWMAVVALLVGLGIAVRLLK